MNKTGFIILGILFLIDLFEIFLNFLNLKKLQSTLSEPNDKLISIYNEEVLKKSIRYQIEKTNFTVFSKLFNIPFFYGIFLLGYIQKYAEFLDASIGNDVLRGIVFFISLVVFNFLINLPFTLYDTFVIEKKYNFNRMTLKLFLKDTVVSGAISFVIVSFLIFCIISFIKFTGGIWWFYASFFTILFSLFLTYIYPTFIAPLFNRFQPLENGELKEEIFNISKKAEFPIENVYKMDASKRTSHSNAYFTGIGKKKRIVLFDTLIKNHTVKEIIAILAHELGHFKLGHVRKMIILSGIIITGGFLCAGFIINREIIYNAFSLPKNIYLGLFLCLILFSPVNFIIQPFLSAVSRKHEFEADYFSIKLTKNKEIFKETLKKLYKDNLANPMPHNLYKTFYYSHPTLIERISRLEEIKL